MRKLAFEGPLRGFCNTGRIFMLAKFPWMAMVLKIATRPPFERPAEVARAGAGRIVQNR